MLRTLSVKIRRDFYSRQLGTKKNILFESENKKGFIHGFSENYVRVKTPWRKNLVDSIVSYDLKEISDDGFVVAENLKKLVTI
jgi:threonylcarbamoyladenosine tRNA methylthiotransferase MtaB